MEQGGRGGSHSFGAYQSFKRCPHIPLEAEHGGGGQYCLPAKRGGEGRRHYCCLRAKGGGAGNGHDAIISWAGCVMGTRSKRFGLGRSDVGWADGLTRTFISRVVSYPCFFVVCCGVRRVCASAL